jgi:hypothetical protein
MAVAVLQDPFNYTRVEQIRFHQQQVVEIFVVRIPENGKFEQLLVGRVHVDVFVHSVVGGLDKKSRHTINFKFKYSFDLVFPQKNTRQ